MCAGRACGAHRRRSLCLRIQWGFSRICEISRHQAQARNTPVKCEAAEVCSWYKTHSNTGILAGVRYVFFLSVPGFQFGHVTVSFGHKTMIYTLKVGFTIVNNFIQHRGLDSRGTIYLSQTEIMWGDAHHIHQETMCEFQSNFSGGPFTFEKLNLFHIK